MPYKNWICVHSPFSNVIRVCLLLTLILSLGSPLTGAEEVPPRDEAEEIQGPSDEGPSSAIDCTESFNEPTKSALRKEMSSWYRHPLRRMAGTALKIPFFPAYLAIKYTARFLGVGSLSLVGASNKAKSLRETLNLRSDFIAAALYLSIYLYTGSTPANTISEEILGLKSGKVIQPASFFSENEVGPLVGINGSSIVDPSHNAFSYISGSDIQDDKRVFYIAESDFKQSLEKLKAISRKHGPIRKLVISSPGNSRVLFMDRGKKTDDVDANWARNNEDFLEEIAPGLFAPNAEVVILTASSDLSYVYTFGEEFAEALFVKLLKKGGTVVIPDRVVYLSAEDFPDQNLAPQSGIPILQGIQSELTDSVLGAYQGIVLLTSHGQTHVVKLKRIHIENQ